MESIRAKAMRGNDGVLWNVTRYTALNSTCLNNMDEKRSVEGESDTGNIEPLGPVDTSREAAIDCDG